MYTNTKRIILILTAAAAFIFTSCDDSTTGVEEPESEVEVQTVEEIPADPDRQGKFTFFSLRTGEVVAASDSASTNWDIAFRGTSILTNSGVSGPGEGGAIVLDVPFEGVSIAPENGYSVDSEEVLAIPTGSGNGWYNYTGGGNPPNAILPIEDVTIILKTGDGSHYAKIDVLSYYEGNPDTSTEEFANNRPPARYYTFRYAIQQTEGLRDLQ